jgi:hypothetical protein
MKPNERTRAWLSARIDPPHIIALVVAIVPTLLVSVYMARHALRSAFKWIAETISRTQVWATVGTLAFGAMALFMVYSIHAFLKFTMTRLRTIVYAAVDVLFPFLGLVLGSTGAFASVADAFSLSANWPFAVTAIVFLVPTGIAIYYAVRPEPEEGHCDHRPGPVGVTVTG